MGSGVGPSVEDGKQSKFTVDRGAKGCAELNSTAPPGVGRDTCRSPASFSVRSADALPVTKLPSCHWSATETSTTNEMPKGTGTLAVFNSAE